MNMYFHSFKIGYNWFYLVGPVLLLIGVFLNYFTTKAILHRRMAHKRARIMARAKDTERPRYGGRDFEKKIAVAKLIYWFAAVAVFVVMFIIEANRGVVQTLDNHLGANDPTGVWAIIIEPAIYLAVAAIYGGLMLLCLHPHDPYKTARTRANKAN